LGGGFFRGSFGGRQAGKLCDEDAGDFGEACVGLFFENERNASAPGFNEVDAAE
jgi:hypothetical protein